MATSLKKPDQPKTRLLGVDLPVDCLIHNDNARSKELIARIEEAGITSIVLVRHDQADDEALPVLKIGDNEMGPNHPSVDNYLEFEAFMARRATE